MTTTPKTKLAKTKSPTKIGGTKFERIIAMLRRPEGATIAELTKLTGWKEHSVRGVLAGAMKKKFGLAIISEKPEKVRIYRAASEPQA